MYAVGEDQSCGYEEQPRSDAVLPCELFSLLHLQFAKDIVRSRDPVATSDFLDVLVVTPCQHAEAAVIADPGVQRLVIALPLQLIQYGWRIAADKQDSAVAFRAWGLTARVQSDRIQRKSRLLSCPANDAQGHRDGGELGYLSKRFHESHAASFDERTSDLG
jgi:hypothetical protein